MHVFKTRLKKRPIHHTVTKKDKHQTTSFFSLFWAELRQESHRGVHCTDKSVCPKTWSNLAPVPVHWEPLQWEEEAWTKTDWTSCPSPSFCLLSYRPIPTCVFVTLGDCPPQLLETKGELLWHDVARNSCCRPCVRHESKFTATRHHFATATAALLQLFQFQLFHIDKYETTQLEDLLLHSALSSIVTTVETSILQQYCIKWCVWRQPFTCKLFYVRQALLWEICASGARMVA